MDGQKSQAKLTRTHSSLLRSSPTIRSSIHSLSSVSEFTPDQETVDLEEQKPHSKPCTPLARSYASRCASVLAIPLLFVYTLFSFFNWDSLSTSENLLLALILVAVFLFFVSKKKDSINKHLNFCKQFLDEHGKTLGLSCFTSKNHSKPVEWIIGESNPSQIEEEEQDFRDISLKKIEREGVEFYSNGDFYEGEFHKGRCNGSGVYHFIVNGRYEGDWIDGRYDGYGIESWARGSRYKGQYRQGLRHGYGVYKFYTGDSYAGGWCKGQSHGIGVQTCADGSCFIGEFKCGVKHGLGCYHFRNGDRYAGSISEIKSMVSESITLPTAIFTKGRGMKGASKVMECIHSEMGSPDRVNGIAAILRYLFPLLRMQFFEQFRLLGELLKVRFTLIGWTGRWRRLWRLLAKPPLPLELLP